MAFSSCRFALLLGLLAWASSSPAQGSQSMLLQPRAGQDFRALESKTLAVMDGTVYVHLDLRQDTDARDREQYILEGSWGQIPFRAVTRRYSESRVLVFETTLLRDYTPCGLAHAEIAKLRVAPRANGELELLDAVLITERTEDTCHLSMQVKSVELMRR